MGEEIFGKVNAYGAWVNVYGEMVKAYGGAASKVKVYGAKASKEVGYLSIPIAPGSH